MFTPIETSLGALLLHQATSIQLYQNGTILGATGLLRQMLSKPNKDTLAFFAGMALSIVPLKLFVPAIVTQFPPVPVSIGAAIITLGVGALVGWGTKVCNGCTSGHMLCGLSRQSGYSLAAVATFFPTAILTHHLAHPSLRTEVCMAQLPCYTPIYPSSSTTLCLVALAAATMILGRILPRLFLDSGPDLKSKEHNRGAAQQIAKSVAGFEFGLGLHISGMASPAKVLSFLSFPNLQVWDPSMMLIILFAIVPNMLEIQFRGFNHPPLLKENFELPTRTVKDVDWRFIAGAMTFGIGWGMTGTCPGPAALRALAQPTWGALWMGGFWLGGLLG